MDVIDVAVTFGVVFSVKTFAFIMKTFIEQAKTHEP